MGNCEEGLTAARQVLGWPCLYLEVAEALPAVRYPPVRFWSLHPPNSATVGLAVLGCMSEQSGRHGGALRRSPPDGQGSFVAAPAQSAAGEAAHSR